jgi:hypothetical protein
MNKMPSLNDSEGFVDESLKITEIDPTSEDVVYTMIQQIQRLFGNRTTVPIKTITDSELQEMYDSGEGEITFHGPHDWALTKTAKAFIQNGTIYINVDRGGIESPVHEFMHIICSVMKYDPKYSNQYYA